MYLHQQNYDQPPNRRRDRHSTHNRRRQRSLKPLILGIVASTALLIAIPGSMPSAWGQAPSLPTESLPPPLRQLERNLPAIGDLLSSDATQVTQGVVRLDGRRLFTIAAPAIGNRPSEAELTPIELRIDIIEDRLWRIVDQGFDADSLRVTYDVDSSSRQPVIYASYVSGDGRSHQDELLTVTDLDAKVNGSEIDAWSAELTKIIEEALLTARQERQPAFLQQQTTVAAVFFLAMLVSSWILSRFQQRLQTERNTLSAQSRSDSEHLTHVSNQGQRITTVLLERRLANQQKQGVNDIKRRLLQAGQLLVWGGGTFLILGLFPYSRWLQPLLVSWIKIPIRLLLIGLITYVAIRLSAVLIDRLFLALQNSTPLVPATSQRLMLRFTTFSTVAKSIAVIICGGVGLILAIATLGIQISPALLAGAGIIGVGVSLASQNLIKDIINGFLILLEDQYGVGDVIVVGEVAGLVENMNLRITQLRNDEGRLITIPNSSITIVQNLSMEWSRVDLSVSVAYTADLDRALAVIEQVAQDMSHDPAWQDLIVEAPTLLGVDKLDHTGATVRLWIKTRPLKQWDVAREYRRRLKYAFDQADIAIGVPQQSLWFSNPPRLARSTPTHRYSEPIDLKGFDN